MCNANRMIKFRPITNHPTCYEIENFRPIFIDKAFLAEIGMEYPISPLVEQELINGSLWYRKLFDAKALNPLEAYCQSETDVSKELDIHNYTGICPTNVLEVSPSEGSCSVGCQYCLVTDGKHIQQIKTFGNYTERLANSLVRNRMSLIVKIENITVSPYRLIILLYLSTVNAAMTKTLMPVMAI